MFFFWGLTGAKTPENRGWNFEKCPKQGKCSICSILSWHVPKKVLKTGEMFNMFTMFNPEGKCSMFNPLPPYFPSGLNILNILNISPVLSTFLEHAPKKIELIEHFPCFKHFLKLVLSKSAQNRGNVQYVQFFGGMRRNSPCSIPFPYFPSALNILNILNISPVLSTFLGTCPKKD